MTKEQEIPERYMKNMKGHLEPISEVSDLDKARNSLVVDMALKAKKLNAEMAQYKAESMGDVEAFVELSAEEYKVIIGGEKGNVTLHSYDGKYRVDRVMAESILADERLHIAEEMMYECAKNNSKDDSDVSKKFIDLAFTRNAQGEVSTRRLLELRKITMDDPNWAKALEIMMDSLKVAGVRPYLRVYERDEKGNYQNITLNFSAI